MPKRKAPEPDPDAFERMARELECDETGEAFERALAHVLPPRKPGEPAPRAADQPKPKGSRRRQKGEPAPSLTERVASEGGGRDAKG